MPFSKNFLVHRITSDLLGASFVLLLSVLNRRRYSFFVSTRLPLYKYVETENAFCCAVHIISDFGVVIYLLNDRGDILDVDI